MQGSMNPLIGPNVLPGKARFPPMSNCYDFALRKAAFKAAKHPDVGLQKGEIREGVYAWVRQIQHRFIVSLAILMKRFLTTGLGTDLY